MRSWKVLPMAALMMLFALLAACNGILEDEGDGGGQHPDTRFINQAARVNETVVDMSQAALDKSSDSEVRRLAQRLIDDHTDAQSDLRQLTRERDLSMPSRPSDMQMDTITRLQGLSGNQFDREFLDAQIREHTRAINQFEDASRGARPAFRDYADRYLPMLREHLRLAEDLRRTVSPM